MLPSGKIRVLATVQASNPDKQMSVLILTGLLPRLSKTDRMGWLMDGHIYDTPGGRQLLKFLKRARSRALASR